MTVTILIGDCRERMRELGDESVDSVVCDPPYHLTSIVKRFGAADAAPAKVGATGAYARASRGFMGQTWDGGDVAFQPELWAEVLRVLKPGGHLVAFSGTRTYHRMASAIEAAGFEVRDMLSWNFGSGFPKSHNIVKALAASGLACTCPKTVVSHHCVSNKNLSDLRNGLAGSQAWGGWPVCPGCGKPVVPEGLGTALKPAHEPICLARKPLIGTVAANVLKHGTGALNIDGCRVGKEDTRGKASKTALGIMNDDGWQPREIVAGSACGRWPANIIHDGSEEVLAEFPREAGGGDGRGRGNGSRPSGFGNIGSDSGSGEPCSTLYSDSGSAARFFYCAKATTEERGEGNDHPTVKPVDLMRWLCRLVTPKGGTVLDPFAGSGSTLIAADAEQFNAIGCELSPEYAAIAERRVRAAAGMFAEVSVSGTA